MPSSFVRDGSLRVLLVTPNYPPVRGGIQTLLYQAITALPDVDAAVVAPGEGAWKEHDREASHEIRRVGVPTARPVIRNALFNVSALRALRGWRPHVVICGHIVASPASWLIAKRYNSALVLYAYGREIGTRPTLAAWALRRSDGAIAISRYTRGELLATVGGTSTVPIYVVPPGVHIAGEVRRIPAHRPTIVTVARLRDWYKGHDRMMEALQYVKQELPEVHWVVIGDGRMRPALEQLASSADLHRNVSFLGEIDEDEKDLWLSRAHVFAMPSRYPKDEPGGEGFGIVYLEAAARGLPSVASNVGAPTEVVVDTETGLLIDPESPREIADALIRLLRDPRATQALGAAARRRVESNFTWDVVGKRLRQVLDEVQVARAANK